MTKLDQFLALIADWKRDFSKASIEPDLLCLSCNND